MGFFDFFKQPDINKEFEESYDKLLLSPGAKPAWRWNRQAVYSTHCGRYVPHQGLYHAAPSEICCIGFIGLELAENLREFGMDVTIVQRPKQLMNPFDADTASFRLGQAIPRWQRDPAGYPDGGRI